MAWVAGVDGCRAGWLVVGVMTPPHGAWEPHIAVYPGFDGVLTASVPFTVIAIDIPIGLLDTPQPGGRTCDQQARRLLARRASSVFSPPSRVCLEATQYEQVRTLGVSRQAFGILPKIREVDRLMSPALQSQVYETHPELAWRTLTGSPMRHNKKTSLGHEERLQALSTLTTAPFYTLRQTLTSTLKAFKRAHVAPDDLLDAYVLAWAACRIAQAQAERVPGLPLVDSRGLRMEIWY